MRVTNLGWMGVRTGAYEAMVRLYGDVLGLERLKDEHHAAWFRLVDGTQVHVYGSGDTDHGFFGPGPVVALAVDDFGAAWARMRDAGIEFIGDIQRAGGVAWNHFRAPDGNVYEIIGPEAGVEAPEPSGDERSRDEQPRNERSPDRVGSRQIVSSGSPYETSIGFSRAVRVGDRVLVSGTAPIWPDGSCHPDVAAQTRRCLEIIVIALSEAGASPEHVVRTRTFITDRGDGEAVGRVHGEVFAGIRPASTMVVVAGLLDPRWKVEIEAEAVLE